MNACFLVSAKSFDKGVYPLVLSRAASERHLSCGAETPSYSEMSFLAVFSEQRHD
jgi:hypothetical protein